MKLRQLTFPASMMRLTTIFSLSGFLMILWLFREHEIRGVNCTSELYSHPATCFGNQYIEIVLWGVIVFLILWELMSAHQIRVFINLAKSVWLAWSFVLLALVSSAWSLLPSLTLNRSLILLMATITAVFIASKVSVHKLLFLLSIFFYILIIASYALILLNPPLGTMQNSPYFGAWNGVFWHRNYLGSFMALGSAVLLFLLLFGKNRKLPYLVMNCLFFLAAIGLVIGSRSAGGILTMLVLLTLTIIVFIWTKIKDKLKIIHYLIISFVMIVSIVLVLTNLDFVFGLLNRKTSLTGRVPLWEFLISNYIPNRLFFGHGYGAIWAFQNFRLILQEQFYWGSPVLIGDNGLIDIVLHLGLAGVLIILSLVFWGLFKTGQFALQKKNGVSFFPLVCMVFIVMSNISLSMLLESEYFVWALMIISILLVSQKTPESETDLN